ncbi:OTU domain, ubiquitin aldehyde binding 2 (predicted), isoform CRA_b [Rattus norvegicus]|uniref:OTU domain, ubiquitin aldehyde binding 2 (Predicted), isoform CRA_b n=1 Tax=Rattus norvegicus TaxID=10116 RepID=A6JEM8_RAT|nr:OTU domain, ubiquitin aldehyde binding 2 (predicted), isoform CRA_b [Rattus norvegicus]EDL81772.1 OTU domain, ubiquitin aldehyde binding 2 (predicted), isoform CRA_b [Rattus norvegicus]
MDASSNGSGDRGWAWENAKTWLSIARLGYSTSLPALGRGGRGAQVLSSSSKCFQFLLSQSSQWGSAEWGTCSPPSESRRKCWHQLPTFNCVILAKPFQL